MAEVLFADASSAGTVEVLDSGGIRVTGRVSRTGVQVYAPWPGAKIQDRPIKVFRPSDEVFQKSSLDSIKSNTVTIGHPPGRLVDATNWKKYAVGHVEGSQITKATDSGEDYIETTMVIQDAKAVKQVKSKELTDISQGYLVDLAWEPGVTTDGKAFDAIQRNIRHNHTALLGAGKGRAGEGARVLLDSSAGEKPKMDEEEKKAFKDSIIKEVAEVVQDAMQTSAKVETEKEKVEPEKEKVKTTDSESEADRKAGEEAARAALLDASEARATAVMDAREECRSMLPKDYDFKGQTVRQIQVDALKHCSPNLKIADSDSDAYVSGSLAVLRASKTRYIKKPVKKEVSDADDYLKDYRTRMESPFNDSWGTN